MAGDRQRFCPVCDRAFEPGESVLACDTCDLLQHPACWSQSGGCNAGCVGSNEPIPVAYGIRPPRPERNPSEGTRVFSRDMPPPPRGVVPGRDPIERVTPIATNDLDEPPSEEPQPIGAPVIGQPAPEPGVIERPPRAQRGRYNDGTNRPPVEDLRLYRREGILRFWYVPVAAIVAILVALGVVWAADQLIGGGDDNDAVPAASETPITAEDGAATAPATSPTPQPTTPVAGALAPGATAVVTGTGECLNIRSAAGTGNEAVACLPDGIELSIVSGPEEADGLSWWEVSGDGTSGWAAEDYLSVD